MKTTFGLLSLALAASFTGGLVALGCGGSSHHSSGGSSNSTNNTANANTNTTGTGTTGTGTTGTGTTGTGTTGTGTTGTGTTGSSGTGSSGTGSSGSGTTGAAGSTTDPEVVSAFNQINASRATQGLTALTLDPTITACALRHAQDCASCAGDQISNFESCAHKDFKSGDTCGARSENQGVANGVSEDQGFTEVHQAMMAEGPPPAGQDNHYANIMDPSATQVGVGLFVDGTGTLWISEEFK